MEVPRVDGFEIRRLLGTGGCGRVYLGAGDGGQGWVAVKFFDGMAIHRSLLARMTARLAEGGWPEGVMPVVHADFDARPALRVTPWIGTGEPETDEEPGECSLQTELGDFPGPRSWPVVRALARALAAMHERRVAHGNLKPGNVFLPESGGVLLTDWALGHMPGVGRFDFTDAVLYQSPEQLADPSGYAEEAGYRWDVYAFGTLAYRLLTGVFPRCHDTFSVVAPPPGVHRREGVHADYSKIAANLRGHPEIAWPDEARNELEAGFREWIERCLELDPLQRPASMIEVAAGFAAAEKEVAVAEERASLLDQRRRAERRAGRAFFCAGAAVAAAVVLGALWRLADSRFANERTARASETAKLAAELRATSSARDQALAAAAEDRRTLDQEREIALSRLQASRKTGDLVFKWAIEKGHRQLPPLDGRDLRLKRLEGYYQEFLANTADQRELAELHAMAKLQLAEISLSAGDAATAAGRLEEALKVWQGMDTDPEMKLRLATDRLLLALLWQKAGDAATATAFHEARRALLGVPKVPSAHDRVRQLTAILDYNEARMLASASKDDQALKQILSATRTLAALVAERPDSAVLRSELAACYMASSSILEGLRLLGDARDVRADAMKVLVEALKRTPEDFSLRLELAGCYGAMAETAVLAGDTAGATGLSAEAMKILEKLAAEQPDNGEVSVRMAAQIGLAAGLMRDRGEAAEAVKSFDKAIRMLEGARAAAPADGMVGYRLAVLRWQKGQAVGNAGQQAEQIRLLGEARTLLVTLEGKPGGGGGPPLEQLQRTLGYLLGDLGHALQMTGRRAEARQAFSDALVYWDLLLKIRRDSEEYTAGRAWVDGRIRELK